MPFRRAYRGRRRRSYRRYPRSRGVTRSDVYRIAKKVDFRGKEAKRALVSTPTATYGTTWTQIVTGLDTVVQGDSGTSRDGNVIHASSMKLWLRMAQSTATPSNTIRVVVLREMDPGGIVAADLPSDGVFGATPAGKNSKYQVLASRTYNLVTPGLLNSAGPTYVAPEFYKDIFQKLDYRMKYESNSTATPVRGATSVWVVSDNNSDKPTITAKAVMYYRDV